MKMNRDQLLKMVKQTKGGKIFSESLDKRRFSVHTSDGYDEESNRTLFFAIEGSPNKIIGWIQQFNHGFEMVTNFGKVYFNSKFKRISKYSSALYG